MTGPCCEGVGWLTIEAGSVTCPTGVHGPVGTVRWPAGLSRWTVHSLDLRVLELGGAGAPYKSPVMTGVCFTQAPVSWHMLASIY